MYKTSYNASEINIESRGSKKEYFLSFMIDPANNAIAICGAKPVGRFGIILYKEAITTNSTRLQTVFLLIFIFIIF
jgi:hypothetical protein